ncbi:acetate uptake transporter [Geoalkalibacter halelectricus]|uniref:Acetate uptake transporter n=1 Tax=Geoalkalibacter halelectricus TaxID=2847045 RepID=A0ABY5ZI31_9BACT|nr:acetate uptake transporter [Geoalkalibacter halelectricus]MDO3378965.1 acetate uptake transporter [Geoalkalibacter halelectricus]UWZ78781.1 acetate uptake transporter [Geoalkalibacter halelectricus]
MSSKSTPAPANTSATVLCQTRSPSGFLTLGLCCLLLGLYQGGLIAFPALVAVGFIYGGLSQAVTGIHEWRHGNAFGAAAFVSCGLFWLSLLPILILPDAGIAKPFDAFASVPYLIMWSLFVGILAHGAGQTEKITGVIFGALALLLGLVAATLVWEPALLRQATCLFGVATGLLATAKGLSLQGLYLARRRALTT